MKLQKFSLYGGLAVTMLLCGCASTPTGNDRPLPLKYYTKAEKNQIHFWSAADRRAYLEAINCVLKNFLAEPIKES